jgi:hypothetical protein
MSITDKQAAAKLLHNLLSGDQSPMKATPEQLAAQLDVRMTEQRADRIKKALEKVQAPFLQRLEKIMPGGSDSAAAGESE